MLCLLLERCVGLGFLLLWGWRRGVEPRGRGRGTCDLLCGGGDMVGAWVKTTAAGLRV